MIKRQSSLYATSARLWNPNPKHPMITLALLSRDMPTCILQKHHPSVIAEKLLLRSHLLRSIIRRLRLPRPLRRQLVRVIVRSLRRLVGLECQLCRFTVEPLLGLAVRERALVGLPAGYEFCDASPEVGELPG